MATPARYPTIAQLQSIAQGLGPRDFMTFARGVNALDPVLGMIAMLRADSATQETHGIGEGIHDLAFIGQTLAAGNLNTPRQAARWWYNRHAHRMAESGINREVDNAVLRLEAWAISNRIV